MLFGYDFDDYTPDPPLRCYTCGAPDQSYGVSECWWCHRTWDEDEYTECDGLDAGDMARNLADAYRPDGVP